MVVSFGPMVSPFLIDSIARFGRVYQTSVYTIANFLKAVFLQELSDNASPEMFSFVDDEAACVDAIVVCRS